jgi:hypothetical protein
MSVVKHIKLEFSCWYKDDGTLGGDVDSLLKDFNFIIIDEGRKLGVVINATKCEVITAEENVLLKSSILRLTLDIKTSDAMLLVAPIGGMQSVGQALVAKLHELRRLSGRLAHLNA